MLRFTTDHEWVQLDGETATVGITDHAQEQLGDLVYVELPEPGTEIAKGGEVAVVESTKAASDVFAPVSGTVTEINTALADDPGKVNSAAEGDGWLYKLTLKDAAELDGLMDRDAYDAFVAGGG